MDSNTTGRDLRDLQATHDRLCMKAIPALRRMAMSTAVDNAGGMGRPLLATFATIGDMLDSDARNLLCIPFMGKKKLSRVYLAIDRMAREMEQRIDGARAADSRPAIQGEAGDRPDREDDGERVLYFSAVMREMPPYLWPHLPVRWDMRAESRRFYADEPADVDVENLHLEEDVDLCALNTILNPWHKLDCADPWGDGRNITRTAHALGRWLAGSPVSPSFVQIVGDDHLQLQGNHRLRTAYFAGYRRAPILMPRHQAPRITQMLKNAKF